MKSENKISGASVNKTVTIELSKLELNKINKFIEDELYLSCSDFVKEAVKEKIQSMEPINIRDIPYNQQRDEIIDFAESHGIVDALEIADALRLDVFCVNEIMAELIREGILDECK